MTTPMTGHELLQLLQSQPSTVLDLPVSVEANDSFALALGIAVDSTGVRICHRSSAITPVSAGLHRADVGAWLDLLRRLVVDDPWFPFSGGDRCHFCDSCTYERNYDLDPPTITYLHEPTCSWLEAVILLGRPHSDHQAKATVEP